MTPREKALARLAKLRATHQEMTPKPLNQQTPEQRAATLQRLLDTLPDKSTSEDW